ncbi:MAG: hypothetical protein R3355_00685 [Pseudomonas sp.]|uniref:hypothetical protein n=1 Tax=Pseudomonas sp. TaxID=306 RepID=UPI00299DD0BA|nr:hypothetical protein [Pseudomonas sp.]MDX1721604.1 hypothetical protein [Pseudomonas sp.]
MAFAPKERKVVAVKKASKTVSILESTPSEYQASVYAQLEKQRRTKSKTRKTNKVENLKSKLIELKSKLRDSHIEAERTELSKEILALEATIKRTRKPKKAWSPILPGSFESKSK